MCDSCCFGVANIYYCCWSRKWVQW